MNIPDDAFFTLLEQALCDRGRETLQRTLYLRLRAYHFARYAGGR